MTKLRPPASTARKRKITAKIARKNLKNLQSKQQLFGRYARQMQAHGKSGITSAHDFRHVNTVARYAERLATFFGAKPEERALASIAGHTHDRIRTASEKLIGKADGVALLRKEFPNSPQFRQKATELVEHAFEQRKRMGKVSDYAHTGEGITSDELTAAFLKDKFRRHLSRTATERVLKAIRLTGQMPNKKNFRKDLVHAGLVFADKFFEANGAFIAFRRAYFMGERKDRREEMQRNGWNEEEAAVRITLDETGKRIKAFSNLDTIPARLHPFVKYQVQWQHRLREGLEKREPWAVNLATTLFKEGLKYGSGQSQRSLEQTIQEYKPIGAEDAAFRQETLRYLSGDLWKTFLQLTSK